MNDIEERAAYFRQRIIAWGAIYGRAFPWRHTTNLYWLLLAEMMLRRAQARQVVPFYEAFIQWFPTPQALAMAREEAVASLLRPLGLAWRVSAFRQMARDIVERYDGQVPWDRKELMSLPGVGEYIADAIRCFGYHEPVAILDTNMVRVTGRYMNMPVHTESRRRAPVKQAVARLVDPHEPRSSNLALLDRAALICRPRNPLCHDCPVAARCAWRNLTRCSEKA